MKRAWMIAAAGILGMWAQFAMGVKGAARAGTVTIDWDNGTRQVLRFDEPAGAAPATQPATQASADDIGLGDRALQGAATQAGAVLGQAAAAEPLGRLGELVSGRTLSVASGTYAVNLDLSALHDLTLQWDGKGTRPILKLARNGWDLVKFGPNSRNITFDGFTIDAGGRNAFHLAGKNLTFRNLDFTACADAFLAENSVDGLLIEDCSVIGDTAMSSYFLWAGAGGATIQNVTVSHCTVPNSTRQHIVRLRFGTIKNILFADCNFANLDRRAASAGGDGQDDAKNTFFIQQGSNITIRHCTLREGSLALGPLGGDDGAQDKEAKTAGVSAVTIDGCTFTGTGLEINAGTSDVTVRDCSFALDFPNPNAGCGAFITLQGQDNSHGWQRAVRNVLIDGCRGTTHTRLARFLAMHGPAEGVRLRDNTFTAPKMVCGAYGVSILSAPDPKYIAESSNNTWPSPGTDGWANGGIFNLGPDGTGTGHGFWSQSQWLALPQVKGDRFQN